MRGKLTRYAYLPRAGDGSAIGVANLADGESEFERLLAAKIAMLDAE